MVINQEKIEYLERYRRSVNRLDALLERRARAVSFGQKVTAGFGRRMAKSTVDRVALSAELVAEIDAEIGSLRAALPGIEKETRTALAGIGNPDYRRVMAYYYVECLSWADTAELSGYGVRYLRDLYPKIVAGMEL